MWEYYTEKIVSPGANKYAHDIRMAELGNDGWELAGVGNWDNDNSPSKYRMFFKRPKKSSQSTGEPYR